MIRSTSVRRLSACAAVLAVTFGLCACTSGHKKKPATTSASATSATPTPTPASSSAKPAALNPLTGLPGVPKTPLIAVKIDDTAPGRPQVNIDKADIVYIEAVEAGLTRLAALFGTNKPTVGYVRSTRPADPDLLRQYGTHHRGVLRRPEGVARPAREGRPARLGPRRGRAVLLPRQPLRIGLHQRQARSRGTREACADQRPAEQRVDVQCQPRGPDHHCRRRR